MKILTGFLVFACIYFTRGTPIMRKESIIISGLLQINKTEVLLSMKQADLPSKGFYELVKTTSEVTGYPQRTTIVWEFYKFIECTKVPEVLKEIQTSVPNILSDDVIKQSLEVMVREDYKKDKSCKINLDINSTSAGESTKRKRRSAGPKISISIDITIEF